MEMELVYAAFNTSPDYNAPSPSLKSLHRTLAGAQEALYPNGAKFRYDPGFTPDKDRWNGPDGFGLIKRMEIKP